MYHRVMHSEVVMVSTAWHTSVYCSWRWDAVYRKNA